MKYYAYKPICKISEIPIYFYTYYPTIDKTFVHAFYLFSYYIMTHNKN